MSKQNDITEYLKSFLGKDEDIPNLLGILAKLTNSTGSFLFRSSKMNKFSYVDSFGMLESSRKPAFRSIVPIVEVTVYPSGSSETGLLLNYLHGNTCCIPLLVSNHVIGVLCLTGGQEYNNVVDKISPYLSLLQLITTNRNIGAECAKLSSNSAYPKDLFMANMSHEIRTPLNGVIGFGQLLMRTEINAVQKGYITSMNKCSIQLMQIINDILDFSKLSSGRMSTNAECFSMYDISEAIQEALGGRMNEKRQKFRFNYDTAPKYIVMDKQKLTQIMVNLVSNAHKFSDVGGTIAVNASCFNPGVLKIDIIDTGIGITEQDQIKLFNTFMQVQESVCKTGSGLGLAISKKLCELLGGKISVSSSIGIGTTFTIDVPFSPYEEVEKSIEIDHEFMKNKYVLVVDDDVNNRIVLSEMLFDWNMKPIVCSSALEALRMVSVGRYDFAIGLIDVCMPITTGPELARQLKDQCPCLPLIALSSIDSFVNSTDFEIKLDKPINKVQLFSAIQKVMSKSSNSCLMNEMTPKIKPDSPTVGNKSCRILIAEDIPFNRTMLADMLEACGYNNINSTENGLLAYKELSRAYEIGEPYDVLLLDLRMPVMDGYDVINAVKRKGWPLPTIVVITASVMESDRNLCTTLGVKYFITKPVEMLELKKVMLRVSN
jgi:signal transduction histidine kinase/CheY-like chemotaxis protein